MNRSRRRALGSILFALFIGVGWLPSLATTLTNPAVSVLDRPFTAIGVLIAVPLLSLGVYRFRNPDLFENPSTTYEPQALPVAIIAGGLVGIGAMLFLIAA